LSMVNGVASASRLGEVSEAEVAQVY